MAWNEPGGGNRDPWNNKGGDQGPPDLDEVVRKLQDKVGGLFGGKRGGSGDGPTEGGGSGGGSKGIGLIVVVVLVGAAIYNSVYTIQPAERGVVQRFGAYHAISGPGLNFKLPFVDTVQVVNVDNVNKITHRGRMLTRDENIADITLEAQFRIQDAADFLFQDANPGATIHGAMESALREVVGKSTFDEITTTNRSGVASRVQIDTQEMLDLYRTGLTMTNVNIQSAQAPNEVKAAFEDANRAREDKQRLQNQAEAYANDIVPKARGEAARTIEDAKGYRAKVVAEADGESQRFLKLLAEYQKAPKVTRERLYLETMQEVLANTGKVLLDVKDGNNLTYLPLDRIVQPARRVEESSSVTAPASIPTGLEPTRSSDTRSRFSRDRGTR